MQVFSGYLEGILELCPAVIADHRGYFFESYNQKGFEAIVGKRLYFVQDNESESRKNVIRGLHYQLNHPQGKLVRAVYGEVYDVVVDLRERSKTFGSWGAVTLSMAKQNQLWIPPGFAHGFLALTDAIVVYKTTEYRYPDSERTIRWDDDDLNIHWPIERAPIISSKDAAGMDFKKADHFD